MFDAYDRIQERVPPGTKLKTPDEKVGAPFTVDAVDLEGLDIRTNRGGKLRISLFTFETAIKFLADRGHTGDRWLAVKDEEFQMLLNMENDRVRAASYVLGILQAAGLVDIDGSRPNKVRLTPDATAPAAPPKPAPTAQAAPVPAARPGQPGQRPGGPSGSPAGARPASAAVPAPQPDTRRGPAPGSAPGRPGPRR